MFSHLLFAGLFVFINSNFKYQFFSLALFFLFNFCKKKKTLTDALACCICNIILYASVLKKQQMEGISFCDYKNDEKPERKRFLFA